MPIVLWASSYSARDAAEERHFDHPNRGAFAVPAGHATRAIPSPHVCSSAMRSSAAVKPLHRRCTLPYLPKWPPTTSRFANYFRSLQSVWSYDTENRCGMQARIDLLEWCCLGASRHGVLFRIGGRYGDSYVTIWRPCVYRSFRAARRRLRNGFRIGADYKLSARYCGERQRYPLNRLL